MAFIYLVVVRLIDLNEKEPLWAVGMLFGLGAVAGCVVRLLVTPKLLDFNLVSGVLIAELARFLAIAVGVGALTYVAFRRGWSDINGLMDGVVYGAAGGLGYATGQAFVQDLKLAGSMVGAAGGQPAPLTGLGSVALVGLSDGVFGALMGIGFAAAIAARRTVMRGLLPLAGFVVAVSAHASYHVLGKGNALSGTEGLVRSWVALLLPLVVIAVVTVIALGREKRAIAEHLSDEADTGIVTADDLAKLRSLVTREAAYLRVLSKGKFGLWQALRQLHNRQVQLALSKNRLAQQTDEAKKSQRLAEVQHLRIAIVHLKQVVDAHDTPPVALPKVEAGSGGPAVQPSSPPVMAAPIPAGNKANGSAASSPSARAPAPAATEPKKVKHAAEIDVAEEGS